MTTVSPLPPRSGYTLPVFACAAAIAALRYLLLPDSQASSDVTLDLVEPAQEATIAIEQVARLTERLALAITRSDPGENLDLTRHTPIWASVEIDGSRPAHGLLLSEQPTIVLLGGEGVGWQQDRQQTAIYRYAQELLRTNLRRWLQQHGRGVAMVVVTIVLPEGRALAQRTSNAAFGVVEGLSLLGTSGIAQPLSAPGQLELFRQDLQAKVQRQQALGEKVTLVFCVGENGLDLVTRLGVAVNRQVKTANWLGSLLVEAGLQGVQSLLLFGYHGKLIKLAGGIFHTHHHVADGRQEILAAHCACAGMATADVQQVFQSATVEAALQYLRQLQQAGPPWVEVVYGRITAAIDQRSRAYVQTHAERDLEIGTVLFDRDRQIFASSPMGQRLLTDLSLQAQRE